ncbi:MAG: GLUG motif-containing protein, partial [Candidatus Gallimonas sp.]
VDEIPLKDGCIFDGWFTEDGEEYTYSTIVRKGVSLKAKWTVSTPVSTADELFAIANDTTANYHLTKDITLPNSNKVWTAIERFSGIFNGNGYTIRNISFTLGDNSTYGFVRTNDGVIENLNFERLTFSQKITSWATDFHSGIIAGNNNGTIKNCHLLSGTMNYTVEVSDDPKNYFAGTLVGHNEGIIVNCSSFIELKVSATVAKGNDYSVVGYIGGIAGGNGGVLSNARFEGSIEYRNYTIQHTSYRNGWHYPRVGGLIGENSGGTVKECYTVADIFTENGRSGNNAHNLHFVGGLIGVNSGKSIVMNSFSKGLLIVKGLVDSTDIGGLIGNNGSSCSVYNCYSTVDIDSNSGGYIGGFVGVNNGANISGCYSSGDITATAGGTMGGFVGWCTNAGGSISNCYSCGNVTTNGGTAGLFVGSSSTAIADCYFMRDARLIVGGVFYDVSSELDGTIDGKYCYDIWSEAFLTEELFWTSEDGWVILTDEDPIFDWEIEVFHNYESYVFEPTCDYYGYTLYLCTDCTRFFVRDIVEPLGHDFDYDHPVVKEATCTESGYKYYVCLREDCTEEHGKICIAETYEPLGHSKGEVVYGAASDGREKTYAATCTEEGRITYSCRVCGTEFSVAVLALGHDEYTSVEEVAPTCYHETQTGEYITVAGHTAEISCKRCGEILQESEEIEPRHYFEYVYTVEPTCTECGEGTATCRMCGYVLMSSQLPALGHVDVNGDYRCDRCKAYMVSSAEEAKEGEYVVITDLTGLKAIANDLNGTYVLGADISVTEDWVPIGTEEYPFTGRLFGEGHKIIGMNSRSLEVGGLFGYNNGFISGITLER